jgi:quercetin dioxygenase-like cupin family protein
MHARRLIPGIAAAALMATSALVARQDPPVTRRIPQFENEHVRVWKSVIQPRQPLSMHRHEHPRAVIALSGGELRIVKDSGQSQTVNWETGKAYWLTSDPPNELHADVNDGDRPIEVIVVELQGVR